jgi:hypothetical protein
MSDSRMTTSILPIHYPLSIFFSAAFGGQEKVFHDYSQWGEGSWSILQMKKMIHPVRLTSLLTKKSVYLFTCLHIVLTVILLMSACTWDTTCIVWMWNFCEAIVKVLDVDYLREPNISEISKPLLIYESREFSRKFGSIYCIHWECMKCHFAWRGQYKGHVDGCTIVLEVFASQDLWFLAF